MNHLSWVLVPVLALLAVAGYWLGNSGWLTEFGDDQPPAVTMTAEAPCTLDARGCRYSVAEKHVAIRGRDAIRALEPFEIRLESSVPVRAAQLLFTMESMDMGLNLFRFREAGDGAWVTTVTLPVCTADRADWIATVTVETDTQILRTTIPFTARATR